MALKDWKKDRRLTIADGIQIYYKDIGSEELIITNYANKYNIKNTFEVVIKEGFLVKERNYFKTKSQALKFAKNYMRKH